MIKIVIVIVTFTCSDCFSSEQYKSLLEVLSVLWKPMLNDKPWVKNESTLISEST